MKRFFCSFLLFLTVGFSAHGFDIPELTGPVMDEAGLLSSTTKRQLVSSLHNLRNEQGVQLQVYVVKSLQGEEIESAAIKIFDKWKLGDAKTDKGLLFLIAPNEKRMRIEVGQGLEGDIPDVIAKRIISDVVTPYFKRQQFNLGVIQGVSSLQNYLGSADTGLNPELAKEKENAKAAEKKSPKGWIFLIVIAVWFVLFLINPSMALALLYALSRGGGGGSGGGGGWSGGGGSSSGGGASGSW